MLRQEIKHFTQSSFRELRKFGLVVGGVFGLLAAFFWLRHKGYWGYFVVPAAPLIFLGAIYPKALRWVYVGWMALAILLGTVVSTILLTTLFYLVVTPIGWLAQWSGKDFLSLRKDARAHSYWIRRDSKLPDKEHYERQF